MFLVSLTIEATPAAPLRNVEPDRAVSSFRRLAVAGDRLEHVSARAGPGRLYLGFFCLGTSRENATGNAQELCRRALAGSPEFAGWKLLSPP
ncbi:hypothetical protein [Dactylosporangium sp. CA-233914]|uniref:hypothetical protein n=1 Tax=Dactylosporangium sp. CA-233914 TaxID=3239934 RepID=UPI003D8ADAB8